jgi:cytochrome oxidase Cu insertion factor (SCO1/SenC/PrrC family)
MIALFAAVTALRVAAAGPTPAQVAPFSFDALAGRTSAVSILTAVRSNACTNVSAQFSYLQHHIEPRSQHLVTVVLDPAANSDRAIALYALRFHLRADRWTMARGSSDASALAHALGIESKPDPSAHVHRVAIVDRAGQIVEVVDTGLGNPYVIKGALDQVAFGHRRDRVLGLLNRWLVWLGMAFLAALGLVKFAAAPRRR